MHGFELFATGENLRLGGFVADEDIQREMAVVEIDAERLEDVLVDGIHVALDEFVIDGDCYLWHLSDNGIHVLHAGGNATELLGHAVAHRQPLQFQVILSEGLVFCLFLFLAVDTAWDEVHLRGLAIASEVTPRETDIA